MKTRQDLEQHIARCMPVIEHFLVAEEDRLKPGEQMEDFYAYIGVYDYLAYYGALIERREDIEAREALIEALARTSG